MPNKLEYKSTIKSKPFLYKEMKKAAELMNQGFKDFEIKDMSRNDNIFQVNTEARKSEIASIVIQRLKAIDDFLVEKIVNGEIGTSKQIVVYSIMKTDRLFFEFMYEVFREKILMGDSTLQDKDFDIFFSRKKEQSKKVASWTNYTFYKLKQVYIRILFEAGFIKGRKRDRVIVKPIIEEELVQHLKKIGDEKYLNSLMGEILVKTIYQRLDEIIERITKESFRKNTGLGNEIGYYIFDYESKYEMLVRDHVRFLKQKINNGDYGFNIKEFDLYEIMLELLETKGYLEKNFTKEQEKGSEFIFNATKKTLRLTEKGDLIVRYIRDRVEKGDVVFITGVGKVWPIIRSHTVLNNLHQVLDEVPVIMFFPGVYDGLELVLFEEIKDDNYYRAFKLVDRY